VRKALVITYYWPPAGGSGVQRWLKFSKYLREFGYESIIYTPENPEFMATDKSLEAEIPEGLEVIKRRIWEPYSLYKKVTGRKEAIRPGFISNHDSVAGASISVGTNASAGANINTKKKASIKKTSFKERLSFFIRSNLFFPDPKMFWIRPSVKFLKRYVVQNGIDIIVTTGPPHSMHIIGRRVSEATSVPWIADFRDPWTKMYNFKYMGYTSLMKSNHERAERKILTSADAVVTVTETIRAELEHIIYSEKGQHNQKTEKSKVFVVTNGYDESDFATPAPKLEPHFTITFTGLFVKSQNPVRFWKILSEMAAEDPVFAGDLKIRLIGHIDQTIFDDISASGLNENLIAMDYMAHEEVINYQRSAQILLLSIGCEPEAKGILTGKFFEYLAARRPIVAFGIKGGDIDLALEKSSAGTMFPYNDENEVKAYIEALYKEFRNAGIPYTSGAIERYSRRNLTEEIASIMDKYVKD